MTVEPANETPVYAESAPPTQAGEMTLIEHLVELRNRVFISAIAVVLGVIICAIFWETILGWLLAPARERIDGFKLYSFSPTDRIGIIFRIAMYGGLILASPVVVYELLAFVTPGLTAREKKLIFPALLGTAVFMLGGMAFAYWVILPVSLDFLYNLGSDQFETAPNGMQYISFVTRIIFWVGLSFELPMVMALAARLGLVSARQLLGFWRYAIVVIFILAAIVTPTPDPLTQTFVAGPLLALYFVGVVFAWLLRRSKGPAPA